MKAEGQRFGLPFRQPEDRSHPFGKKIVLAPQQSEPAAFQEGCDMLFVGAEEGEKNRAKQVRKTFLTTYS